MAADLHNTNAKPKIKEVIKKYIPIKIAIILVSFLIPYHALISKYMIIIHQNHMTKLTKMQIELFFLSNDNNLMFCKLSVKNKSLKMGYFINHGTIFMPPQLTSSTFCYRLKVIARTSN